MKNYYKSIASVMVTFALIVSAIAPAATVVAFDRTLEVSPTISSDDFGDHTFCRLTASRTIVDYGGSVTLNWETGGFDTIKVNGETVSGDSGEVEIDSIYTRTTFRLEATNDSGSTCTQTVIVDCEPEPADVECTLSATPLTIPYGGKTTLKWTSQGGDGVIIDNGIGNKPENGQIEVGPLYEDTTFTLIVDEGLVLSPHYGTKCVVTVEVEEPDVPLLCEDFGYDFKVAKYEWNGSSYVKEYLKSGYSINVTGDTNTANWTANPAVDGVIAKAATYVAEFAGGTSGSVNKSQIGTGQNGISHIAFCGNYEPEPNECKLIIDKTVNKTSVEVGDTVTYTINVKNIGDADCTGGGVKIVDEVDDNLRYVSHTVTSNITPGYGSKSVYDSTNHTLYFNGNVLTPGEEGTITWKGEVQTPVQCGDFKVNNQAKVTAKELNNFNTWVYSPTVMTNVNNDCAPKNCELKLDKSVNKANANVGDNVTYTINIENVGDANCTGSGVRIEDVVDDNLKYLRHWLTDNLGPGYIDIPVYTSSNRTLTFNGFVLEPGEKGTITWRAKVLAPAQCGDFDVYNQARATAVELNDFKDWVYSNTVKTAIDNDCYEPPDPKCTLTPEFQSVEYGAKASLTWTTEGVHTVTLTDFGNVDLNGTTETEALFSNKSYTLTATGEGGTVTCDADVEVGEPKDEFAEVVAHKIVCTDEADLPNWGAGGPDITANTAADWVASHDSCSFVADWEFEWTDDQSNDPGDTLVGKAGSPWNAFGPTDSFGKTGVTINLTELNDTHVWFREVLQTDYIPFTHGANNGTNIDDVSAEFYCHTDVINYDNRDFISGMNDGETYYCVAWNSPVPEVVTPSCDLFSADPSTIMVGGSSTLTWESSNAVQAFINNGIGAVDVDGSIEVSPIANTIYVLTLIGDQDTTVDCEVPVTVSEDSVPVCEMFTATPNSLPAEGGDVTLEWEVIGAETVNITPDIGAVSLTGNSVVNVTESTTYELTAVDDNGDEVSCIAPVAVADPVPFSCEQNVTFTASDTSIRRGQTIVLEWDTTDVDEVKISGINLPGLSGTKEVSPTSNITYVLTAIQGDRSVDCPVSIDVDTGGGGGGSSSPRCELEISDEKIKRGEEVTITWDTSNVSEITLTDDEDEIIFTTDDFLSTDKKEYFDGSVTLRPTRDTEFELLAERGSKTKVCKVEVEVEDDVIVLQTRDQQPLVAGISLSQVPYTGFEAGPVMTALFYLLLIVWALFVTYLLVVRNRQTAFEAAGPAVESNHIESTPEDVRPDVFVESVTVEAPSSTFTPNNLPTGNPVIGYGNEEKTVEFNPHQITDAEATEIENRAHAQKALLSSDAIRYFVATTEGEVERNEVLDEVIAEAKTNYPLEDGWIVINESRMKNLCDVCKQNRVWSKPETFVPATVPEGTGSLAESIVTGNVVAAYEMIGSRPMFSLADAAADLDAVYRSRKGEDVHVSELLKTETTNLSDEQIKNMIAALTGALDGTYTDEASAVKMAIMKAVKEVA